MLKLAGSVMIVSAAFFCGFYKAYSLKQRSESLSRTITALAVLESEISYGKRDIKSIFKTIGETQKLPLFADAAEEMSVHNSKTALCRSIDKQAMFLSGTDKSILKLLAENLGMTDTKNQLGAIAHVRSLLEEAQNSALEEYKKNGRFYRSAGILCGLLAVILLY